MNDSDAHTLTPTTARAANTQTDLTITLRLARGALPYGCVASNALPYTRPCRARILNALPAELRMARTENIPTIAAKGRTGSTATLIAKTSGTTIAITTPFASTASPLDFSSNHTCA